MSEAVATAICKVMGDVQKLYKDEDNKYGKYKFVSVDSFLEMIRPLCAKHGLIIIQDEVSCEIHETPGNKDKDPTAWLGITFSFMIAHTSGQLWPHQPRRSIMVNASMGAQAYGSAQSYALKHFLRSLFQVATGETDPESNMKPGTLPGTSGRDYWADPENPTEYEKEGLTRSARSKKKVERYTPWIQSCDNPAALEEWWNKSEHAIKGLTQHWRKQLTEIWEARINELRGDDVEGLVSDKPKPVLSGVSREERSKWISEASQKDLEDWAETHEGTKTLLNDPDMASHYQNRMDTLKGRHHIVL